MCLVLETFPECLYLRMHSLIFVLTEYFVFFLLGDICQQFTREIFDMYQNYSYYKHWKFELLNYTPADYGKHKLKTLLEVLKLILLIMLGLKACATTSGLQKST